MAERAPLVADWGHWLGLGALACTLPRCSPRVCSFLPVFAGWLGARGVGSGGGCAVAVGSWCGGWASGGGGVCSGAEVAPTVKDQLSPSEIVLGRLALRSELSLGLLGPTQGSYNQDQALLNFFGGYADVGGEL